MIPTKGRVRRSSSLMHDDPYTLIIALDSQVGGALGVASYYCLLVLI